VHLEFFLRLKEWANFLSVGITFDVQKTNPEIYETSGSKGLVGFSCRDFIVRLFLFRKFKMQ
jgi:uncharacterized protein YjaZ